MLRLIGFFVLLYLTCLVESYAGIYIGGLVAGKEIDNILNFGIIFCVTVLFQGYYMAKNEMYAISAFLTGFWTAMIALAGVGFYSTTQTWLGLVTPLPISFLLWDVFFLILSNVKPKE
jgi:hypothetical protein